VNCSNLVILVLELESGHLVAAVAFVVGLELEVEINGSLGLVEVESVSLLGQAQNVGVAAGLVWLASFYVSICGCNYGLELV